MPTDPGTRRKIRSPALPRIPRRPAAAMSCGPSSRRRSARQTAPTATAGSMPNCRAGTWPPVLNWCATSCANSAWCHARYAQRRWSLTRRPRHPRRTRLAATSRVEAPGERLASNRGSNHISANTAVSSPDWDWMFRRPDRDLLRQRLAASFFGVLKNERVARVSYPARGETQRDIRCTRHTRERF